MPEQIDLTNPVPATGAVNNRSIVGILLDKGATDEKAKVHVMLQPDGSDEREWFVAAAGEEALPIISFVNTGNFSGSNKSLFNRAAQYLIDNGIVGGTISGTPD